MVSRKTVQLYFYSCAEFLCRQSKEKWFVEKTASSPFLLILYGRLSSYKLCGRKRKPKGRFNSLH